MNGIYVKGLYYAFGANDFGAVADPIEFANAYANHCAKDGSHVAVQDCFKMFLAGQTEFKR